jgi:integrase
MARPGRKDRGLVERPKGSGIWWVRLYHLGREHWFGPHASKTAARTFYERTKREQREERFDPDRYHRRGRKITLKEWITEYLEFMTARSEREQKRYGRWWMKLWGRKRLEEITTGDLTRLQAKLFNKGKKAPGTVNRYFAFLKHLYYLALREGKVEKNPVVGVKFFKEPHGRLRFLTEKEDLALCKAMNPEDWALVAFALNTGLRRSEQFELKWQYIDQENGVLTIPRSKSGETRHVPLNDVVLTILKGLNSWMTSPWVFPSPGNPGRPQDAQNFYNRVFIPALDAAGIEGAVWHSLRHTFASRLVMAGVDLRTVQELMGHKDIKMTLRYSHLSSGHLKDAVARLLKSKESLPAENPKSPNPTVTKTGKPDESQDPSDHNPLETWRAWRELNPRPTDSKSAALSS